MDILCIRNIFSFMLIIEVNSQYEFFKVLNGSPTTIQQYPILAQMLLDAWGNQQFVQHCAGVVLTSRHVISTAHCFQYNRDTGRNYSQPQHWKVRVGSSDRNSGGTIHHIKKIISHKGFDRNLYINDIAVIVVIKKFLIGNSVRQGTIVRFGTEIKPNSMCTLVGWGATERDGPQPNQLQYIHMVAIDQEDCKKRYNSIGATITDSMMCAGRTDIDGVDGCFGDSGGPLIYKGVVVGLVSFGHSCGIRYYPGVYTKVSSYTKWIINTIANNR